MRGDFDLCWIVLARAFLERKFDHAIAQVIVEAIRVLLKGFNAGQASELDAPPVTTPNTRSRDRTGDTYQVTIIRECARRMLSRETICIA